MSVILYANLRKNAWFKVIVLIVWDLKLATILLKLTIVDIFIFTIMDRKFTGKITMIPKDLTHLASYELLHYKLILGCWIEHLVQFVEQLSDIMHHILIVLLSDSPVSRWEQTSELKREAVFDLNQPHPQIVVFGNNKF